jgi:GT2 family glycosyltransferase
VALVTWNAAEALPAFLTSLLAQDLGEIELVVADNASADGSIDLVRAAWPSARVLEMGSNTGFAVAANAAIEASSAPLVALLNYDLELEPVYLRRCAEALDADTRLGSVQGLLLRPGGALVDSAGHAVTRGRWFRNRGENRAPGEVTDELAVFGVTAAAAVYRRAMLDDVANVTGHVFCPEFFAYLEDVDLDYRARWLGWHSELVPDAVAEHRHSGSGGRAQSSIQRHILKNRLLVLMRNESARNLALDLPWVAGQMMARWGYALVTRPGSLRGVVDALRLWPVERAARRQVKAARRRPPKVLRRWLRDGGGGFATRTGLPRGGA